MLFLDIETTGLNPRAKDAAVLMVGVLGDKPEDEPRVFHMASKHPETWRARLVKLCGKLPPVMGHNIKFDIVYAKRFGANIEAAGDTMLGAHMVDENRPLGLKSLMADFMGGDWSYDGVWDDSDPEAMAAYLKKDLLATRELYRINKGKLTSNQKKLLRKVVVPAINMLAETEDYGIPISRDKLEIASRKYTSELAEIDAQLDSEIPSEIPEGIQVKWGTTNFQRWFLYDYLGIPKKEVGKPTKAFPNGAPSLSKKALAYMDHPIAKTLLERSRLKKNIDGFITPYKDQIDGKGRLYTSFKLHGTVTGRLSSGKVCDGVGVNLQQVPKDPYIRGLVAAPEGYKIIEADYSQLELRVAAVVSRDKNMLQLYRDGGDIHSQTTRAIGLDPDNSFDRRKAKIVNFGFLYGMSAKSFVQFAKVSYGTDITLDEAEQFREDFFRHWSGLRPWHARAKARAHKLGYSSTMFGRRRHLPGLYSSDEYEVAAAERQAVNSQVQGTGSDVMLRAAVQVWSSLEGDSHILGLVHDAVLVLVPEELAETTACMIQETMERPLPHFDCPLVADVEIGTCWGPEIEV